MFTSARIERSIELNLVHKGAYKPFESKIIISRTGIAIKSDNVYLNFLPSSIASDIAKSSVAAIDRTGSLDLCDTHDSTWNIESLESVPMRRPDM